MNDHVVILDVREDLRHGREPFGRIMETVARLRENEKLLLFAPFEPVPLFRVLARQGFSHQAKPTHSGDWQVLFERKAIPIAPDTVERPESRSAACPAVLEVDARGLEPPQPLVVILEALAALPEGQELRAHTDRRPAHLYSQLEERGFVGKSKEQEDGSFITYIGRR